MPSYLLLYRGPASDAMSAPPEQQKAINAAWTTYFGKHGPAIKDGGNPTVSRGNVAGNGKSVSAADVNGYSIIDAKDLAAAKAIVAGGHPHLRDARNSIDILEITPVPGM